jgi:hypothetical protein
MPAGIVARAERHDDRAQGARFPIRTKIEGQLSRRLCVKIDARAKPEI